MACRTADQAWSKGLDAGRVQLKRDGTRWGTGGEVKGKLANGVGSQSPSHRFTLPRNMVYPALLPLMGTPRLPAVDWTDAPADLNGLVRFAERTILVYARVPSHFKRTLHAANSNSRPSDYQCTVFSNKVQLSGRLAVTTNPDMCSSAVLK